MSTKHVKKSFEDFRKGTFGNGGQNIYCSKKGILQRVFNYDVTGSGYPCIPVANSHCMGERPPIRILTEKGKEFSESFLPSEGTYDAAVYDLNGNGYDDLVIACQNNGTHTDVCGIIYHGSKDGLSVDYREELPAGDSLGVAIGRFSGKLPEICFIRSSGLRIYRQEDGGFNAILFSDINIQAVSGAAADLDGDGFDDLYLRLADGRLMVLWGSKNGLLAENCTVVDTTEPEPAATRGTTATRRPHSAGFRCNILTFGKKKLLFAGGSSAAFYGCTSDRKFIKEKSIPLDHVIYALSGPFMKEGQDDLVILRSESFDENSKCCLYPAWNTDAPITFPARSVLSGSFAKLRQGPVLLVAQGRTCDDHTVKQQIISFTSRKPEVVWEFTAFEPARLLPGKFDGKETVIVCADHESGKFKGKELTRLYLGGDWEYGEDHVIELLGSAAVDMHLADFNDDGRTDVLVTNCSENDPAGDPGSYLYYQDENGLSNDRRTILPTVRAHGSAVGDFRHSGYLDIATAGICNREVRIFRGGPDGYSLDRCDRLVLGPQTENYQPSVGDVFSDDSIWPEGEKELASTFGEIRWIFAADFNGDGWLDLFIGSHAMPYAYIYFGGPDGFAAERCQKLNAPGAINCTVADLNKNGYPDLVISHHYIASKKAEYEAYLSIYWGGPDGYSDDRKTMLPTHCANAVTAGDFNGNGWLDLYATCYNNGRSRDLLSYVFVNDHGHFNYRNNYTLFNHSGSGCIAGDFNGDGYTDLVIASHKENGNHISNSVLFYGGPDGLKQENYTLLPSIGPHGLSTVHPGNLLDKGPREYYESEALDVPAGTRNAKISVMAEFLGKGWLEIQWRFAADKDSLNDAKWLPVCENESCIHVPEGNSAASYRLALCAPCSAGNVRVSQVMAEFF